MSHGTRVNCATTAQLTEMPFDRLTRVDPRNHVLHGSQDRTKPFAAAMRPCAKLLWPVLPFIVDKQAKKERRRTEYVEGGVVLGVPVHLVIDTLAMRDLAVASRGKHDPAGVLVILE